MDRIDLEDLIDLEIVQVPGLEYVEHPTTRDALFAILRRLHELPETVHTTSDDN